MNINPPAGGRYTRLELLLEMLRMCEGIRDAVASERVSLAPDPFFGVPLTSHNRAHGWKRQSVIAYVDSEGTWHCREHAI